MKKLLSFIVLFISITTYSQKEANFWYFGRNAGVDFSSGNPVALTNGQLNTFEGCSTIADKDGNLLFYSDGSQVWDKDHNVMPDGFDLRGHPSSAQSALIVPNPSDSKIFYLFTIDSQERDIFGVQYSEVDLNLNGGLGDISSKNNPLINTGIEKITSVQSDDCDSFWVIAADFQKFYSYEVNSSGVNPTPKESNFLTPLFGNTRGYLKVSPDGKTIVAASANAGTFIYDFNSTNGEITNGRRLDLSGEPGYGVEFSITGKKLYIATGNFDNSIDAKLFQFDLTSKNIDDINNSRGTAFHTYTGTRGALQLAPNGKIYYAINNQPWLGVINFPEESKDNIQYTHNGVNLGGNNSSQGLPPFIQSFFLPTDILDADTNLVINNTTQTFCIGETYTLKAGKEETGAKYTWTKDGKTLGTSVTLEVTNDNDGSGTYELKIELSNKCNSILNAKIDIVFESKPVVNTIPLYEQCDIDTNPIDGKTGFNLKSREAELSGGVSGVNIEFFETMAKLNANDPIIDTENYTNVNPFNQKVFVKITNTTTECFQTGEIDLKVNPTTLTSYRNIYTCEIDSNSTNPNATNSLGNGMGVFNFDEKINDIITESSGVFSLTTHDFELYRTRDDATLQINKITAPYDDDLFSNDNDVFVRISLKGSSSCSGIGQFKVFINPLPIPQGNINTTYLCLNNPIDIPQLRTVDLNANTGVSGDTYQWYLNGNPISGATNAIHKANEAGTYKVEAFRAYENIIGYPADNSSCTGYNTFIVETSNFPIITGIDSQDDQDNPNENKIIVTVNGIGDYEYAINSTSLSDFVKGADNFTYTFTNIQPGLNTIYVRDKNGCGSIAQSQQISTLYFQRHFTPNGDGDFDTWKILGVDNHNFYRSAKIQVFDRYGKLLTVINQKSNNGWDGTYNGKKLPSNDYWYNAELIDRNGNVRKKTGHFSLLRK